MRGWADGAGAVLPRIGAIEGIGDRAGGIRVRDGEMESSGHGAAELAEERCVQLRIETSGAEAAEVCGIQGGEEVGSELFEFGHPPCVARESLAVTNVRRDGELAGIAPAGGFADDGAVDVGGAGGEASQVVGGREGAVIEHVFLDTVAEESTELGPGAQLRVDAGGGVVVADVDAITADELVEDDFLVPGEEDPFGGGERRGGAAMGGVPVVVGPIFGFGEDMQEHVIDEVLDIDHGSDGLVGGLGCDPDVDVSHHLVPVRHAAIQQLGEVPDDIPVLGPAAQVTGEELGVESFGGIVNAPVEAIEIEVHKRAAPREPAHVAERVLHPDVAEEQGILGPVALAAPGETRDQVRVGITRGPRIGKASAQDDGIEPVDTAIEPVVIEFGRAVAAFEEQPQGVFRGSNIVATRVALHLDAAMDGERGGTVGVDQLDTGGPFPLGSFAGGVVVDAVRGMPEVRVCGDDRERRDGTEIFLERGLIAGVADHIRVHTVVGGVTGLPNRGVSGLGVGLIEHLIEEDIRMRVDIAREPARPKRGGTQECRFLDRDRRGVNRAGGGGRRAAIGGPPDLRVRGGAGDGDGDGRVIIPAIDAELGVRHKSRVTRTVGPAGGGRTKIAPRRFSTRGNNQFRHDQKVLVVGAQVQALDGQHILAVHQQARRQRDGNILEPDGVGWRALGGGRRVPFGLGGGVAGGNLLSIQPGDEAVVVLHPQGEGRDRPGVGDRKRHANERGGVVPAHGRPEIIGDERAIAGLEELKGVQINAVVHSAAASAFDLEPAGGG